MADQRTIQELLARTRPDGQGREWDRPPEGLPPGVPPPWRRCHGKATAAWASGNTVTLDPCTAAGVDIPGMANVTGYIISPTGGNPADAGLKPVIALNDVLAYLAFGTNQGILLNPKWMVDTTWAGAVLGVEISFTYWINVTQNKNPTYIDQVNDWRGRIIHAVGEGYLGTPAASLDAPWQAALGHVVKMVGQTFPAPGGNHRVAGTVIAAADVGVFIERDTGWLYYTVGAFAAQLQYRFLLSGSPQKDTPDETT